VRWPQLRGPWASATAALSLDLFADEAGEIDPRQLRAKLSRECSPANSIAYSGVRLVVPLGSCPSSGSPGIRSAAGKDRLRPTGLWMRQHQPELKSSRRTVGCVPPSEGENPDLFWAGARRRGNFGVRTQLRVPASSDKTVLSGHLKYPMRHARTC